MRRSYSSTLVALLTCAPLHGAFSQASYELAGTIVSPAHVTPNGSISVNGQLITAVGAKPGANAIDVDGVIFPGLVDLHNHLSWNVFPRWSRGRLFGNRYEWQEATDYLHALSGPHAILVDSKPPRTSHLCAMNRYAEVKEIVNGATSTVGGDSLACVRGLARNLDWLGEFTANQQLGTEPCVISSFHFSRVSRAMSRQSATWASRRWALVRLSLPIRLSQLRSHGINHQCRERLLPILPRERTHPLGANSPCLRGMDIS